MNSKQESRYQSFRIDFDASSGSIRYLYPRSNVMDVYTTEATFQIELAETIDPLGKNPNVPHIYKKNFRFWQQKSNYFSFNNRIG